MPRSNILLSFLFITCFSFGQLPDTDIWLVDLRDSAGKIVFGVPKNITGREGYDNQPFFTRDGERLMFTSVREGTQSDIYAYSVSSGNTSRLTKTTTSEYSPTPTPDGKHFSVVMVEKDSSQRVWQFPFEGGEPTLVLDKIDSVGYHCWIGNDSLAVFLLTDPFSLQLTDIKTQKLTFLADSVGRCLQYYKLSGGLSYVEKNYSDFWTIRNLHFKGYVSSNTVAKTLKGCEDFAWRGKTLFMCREGKIYVFNYGKARNVYDWKEVTDLSSYGISNVTRIAFSPDGKRLALVNNKITQ